MRLFSAGILLILLVFCGCAFEVEYEPEIRDFHTAIIGAPSQASSIRGLPRIASKLRATPRQLIDLRYLDD